MLVGLAAGATAAGATAVAAAGALRVWAQRKDLRAEGISFGNDARLKLDVYAPDGNTAAARTVVMYLYGGGWQGGRRAALPRVNAGRARHRDRRAGRIIPRVYPQAVFPGFVEDAAVRWTHDHIREYSTAAIRRGSSSWDTRRARISRQWSTAPKYLQADSCLKRRCTG
ncbi:hypothetical protein BUMB_05529c [Candidatus Paraburkholderia calva]|nr:hypothetical protein BUMB_05529c [Candidatus Paraburkholderia calva]